MSELMLSLLVWIGGNTDYNTDLDLPNVSLVTQHNLCRLYGVDHKQRCDDLGLKGFYNKELTIYLGTEFDPADPHHQSRLLHELVHYVQWSNGKGDSECMGNLEVEAYDLQDAWRAARSMAPVLADFNRFMLEISCSA